MKRRGVGKSLYILFIFSMLFFIGSLVSSYFLYFEVGLLDITGLVTGEGTVTLSNAGVAGLYFEGNNLSFGSGYFNGTGDCSYKLYSTLDTNNSASRNSDLGVDPNCWVNTTEFLNGNTSRSFSLVNNGSVAVNVSAIADQNGEDWLCGGNCQLTAVAGLSLYSYNLESDSCTGLTDGFENLITSDAIFTVGLCDSLDFVDISDSLNVYINASIPKDTTAGAKSLTITFQAITG
ncbi:hypothetical protein J4467_00105 [Candidatus Woesearchaeota archaeon]|nr:hypothetical protein [Candidatus Woesearchaeota archaeon]